MPSPHFSMTRAVGGMLNLRSNERAPVALLWTHSFCLGVGVAYLVSAALPLFLASFSIEYLPLAFAAAGIVELAFGYYSERLQHRMGKARTMRAMPLVLAAGTIAFSVWIIQSGTNPTPVAAFGLLVWARILVFASDNEFWGLPMHLFDVRQGKRLFSLIDSGSFLAKILGYFSVPILTQFLRVPDLLLFSAVGTGASTIVLEQFLRRFPHALQSHRAPHTHHSEHREPDHISFLTTVRNKLDANRYLVTLAVVAFSATFAMTCIDYGFLREIELRSQSLTAIANFLGIFLGTTRLVSLGLKVGIIGRLFGKFGLAKTNAVLPIGLFLTMSAGIVLTIGSSESAMIWTFILAMGLVELWSDAVHVPAQAVAFQPLPPKERHRGHETIGGVVEPIALLAAGITLFFLSVSVGFSLRGIGLVMLSIFIAWGISIWWFDREYRETVIRALKHRRLTPAETVWDNAAKKIIAKKLESTHAEEVQYALRLIPQKEPAFLLHSMPVLLDHQATAVRLAALERMEEFPLAGEDRADALRLLEIVLRREHEEPVVLGQALRLYTAYGPELDSDTLSHWRNDARLAVREGLLGGLIQYKGIDGVLLAGEYVRTMVQSSDPRDRETAAEIIGKVGSKQFYHTLLPLLHDGKESVRITALRAAARVAHPELSAPLLDEYLAPETRRELRALCEAALIAIGSDALPSVMRRIDQGEFDNVRLVRIARVVGHWARHSKKELSRSLFETTTHNTSAERAAHLLIQVLEWPQDHPRILGTLRLAALHALVSNGISVPEEVCERLMLDELSRGEDLTAAINSTPSHSNEPAMLARNALAYELELVTHRILLLLALRHDPATINRVRDSLQIGDMRHRANAFETLEHLLPSDRAKRVIALFEMSLGWKAGTEVHERTAANADPAWERILNDEHHFYHSWTLATAQYWNALLHNNSTAPMPLQFERVILLKSVDLFRETPDAIVSHVAHALEEVHVQPQETFIRKGEQGHCLYIIVEGRVRVHDGERTLSELSSRDVVGEMALLDPEPRSASVTALEETTLLKLDREVFYDLMVDNIEIARGAIQMLCRRIRKLNAQKNLELA